MPINLSLFISILNLLFIFNSQVNANQNENFDLLNTHNNPFKSYKSFFNPNNYDYTIKHDQLIGSNHYYQPSKRDLTKLNNDNEFENTIKYEYDLPSSEYQKIKYSDHPEEVSSIDYPSTKYEYKSNDDLDILTNKQHETVDKKLNKDEIALLNSLSDEDKSFFHLNGLGSFREWFKNKFRNNLHYINRFKFHPLVMDEYSYDEQDKWGGTCTDKNALQSPISLGYHNSRLDFRTKVDLGVKYSKRLDVELENKGHTAQFEIPAEYGDLIITGPAFNYEVFKATGVHFHWGENDTLGSEHVLNGKRYPLEMHIVHFNTKYSNLEDALMHKDGVAVIGIFFQIGRENKEMAPIVDNLNSIRCKNQKTNIKGVNLLRLFPSKVRRLYQYFGSLAPPCTPVVNWIIIEDANIISSEQMAKFRLMTTDVLCQNENLRNWRDLQDIKNRIIKRSIKI